jgi:hypothetical protein
MARKMRWPTTGLRLGVRADDRAFFVSVRERSLAFLNIRRLPSLSSG